MTDLTPGTPRYAVYDPVEERFKWFSTRAKAEEAARRWLNDARDVAPSDGWPESMGSLAVYECRPLLVAHEVDRKSAIECPEERVDHEDCDVCEGTGLIDDLEGEAWFHQDDFDYICNYELVSAGSAEALEAKVERLTKALKAIAGPHGYDPPERHDLQAIARAALEDR